MSSAIKDRFTQLFNNDRQAVLALLACSAALQLDDETACEAVELVAQSNGSSRELMRRVKKLGCVWKEWNGLWHVSEDVRSELFDLLAKELPENTILELRDRLAQKADARAASIDAADQFAAHQKLQARFEAAYQRLLIPKESEKGAHELAQLWRESPRSDGDAMARSVDYLADELSRQLKRLPDAVVFLRGIAARNRGDDHAQEQYFGKLWKRARIGQPGHIHAIGSHFLGLLIKQRDPKTAEKALRDSVSWMESGPEKGMVCYSLGNLLALSPDNWREANRAYQQALQLIIDPNDKAQVYAALAELSRKTLDRPDQVETELTKRADLPAPGIGADDVPLTADELVPSVRDQMYQFAVNQLRHRKGRYLISSLVEELRLKFFEAHETAWQGPSEFFAYVGVVLRRILVNQVRTQYSTKLDTERHTEWLSNVEPFGAQPDADLLALDDALNRLQKIDPNQGRIVELVFYAGLPIEKTAELMQMPAAVVAHEWRMAKAFLKRELTRGKAVLKALNLASSMTTTALSQEFRS